MTDALKTNAQIENFIKRQELRSQLAFYKDGFDYLRPRKSLKRFQELRVSEVWDSVIKTSFFGEELSDAPLELWRLVRKIYKSESLGELLPLHQAIRLLDIYRLQSKQLATVETRMRELNRLHESLLEKLEQLFALGEDHPEGKRNLQQINADYYALEEIRKGLKGSCTRLEMILISAQKAAQSRQIRRDLGDLSAKLPRTTQASDMDVRVESLEDLERAVGREIETYLQLERETEEHLR